MHLCGRGKRQRQLGGAAPRGSLPIAAPRKQRLRRVRGVFAVGANGGGPPRFALQGGGASVARRPIRGR